MINVTDTIKKAYDTSTTQCDKIVIDNIEYSVNNVQYLDDCYNEGNIFGTAIARTLQFEIENIANLEGKEFEYLTGIEIGNNIEWISLGNFIVESVEPNDTTNVNIVNAMDYMLKSNVEYISLLDYSSGKINILQVLQEACTNAGLILATTDFPNKDFIVDSNQFNQGTIIRQVIQAVAQISGTVAKIKSDNKLYLINPNSITEVSKVFTLNNYAEAEIKRATHPINLVSLGMNDVEGENITLRDEESIQQDGENSLVINDNPFAYTQEKREQLITALFNAVKRFEYKAFLFDCQGLPYLETMDKIQFKDRQGNTHNSYVFRFNYKSPKGLESSIEAPSIIKATVNYQNIPSALDRLKRTELIVDKQNQTITGLVQDTTKNSEKLAQIELTVDSITQTVSSAEEIAQGALDAVNEVIEETITNIDVMYALADSSTEAPTTGWSTIAPQWENGKYMWQKTVTTYRDETTKETEPTCISGAKGEKGEQGIPGQDGGKGDTGIGVEEIEEQYYLSTSDTTQSGGSWKTTQDPWVPEKYIWTRNKITWTDNTVTYTTPILAEGINNANSTANSAKDTVDSVNNNLNNNYYTKKEAASQMNQTAEAFNFKLESTGGLNLIQNSTLELGLDTNNAYSGDIEIKKNTDIRNNTVSKSAILINTGYIQTEEIKITPGIDYTFSCLIMKNELTNVTVTITTDKEELYDIECEADIFQKFSFIFNSAIETVKIKIATDNNYCLVADRMLNSGNSSLGWQLYQGEVITSSTKITDDGITIESSDSKTKWIANSSENKIVNKDTGEVVVSFNGDETDMTKARVTERFTVGKLRETVLENGDIIFTFDD